MEINNLILCSLCEMNQVCKYRQDTEEFMEKNGVIASEDMPENLSVNYNCKYRKYQTTRLYSDTDCSKQINDTFSIAPGKGYLY